MIRPDVIEIVPLGRNTGLLPMEARKENSSLLVCPESHEPMYYFA